MRGYDITVSFDGFSLSQHFDCTYNAGPPAFYRLHWPADAVPSAKYPTPAGSYTFSSKESMPDFRLIPVAKEAVIYLAHTPIHDSPLFVVHLQPSDGSLVFQDYILHLHRIEEHLFSCGAALGNVSCDSAAVQLKLLQCVARPFDAAADEQLLQACIGAAISGSELLEWGTLSNAMTRPIGLLMQRRKRLLEVGWQPGEILTI